MAFASLVLDRYRDVKKIVNSRDEDDDSVDALIEKSIRPRPQITRRTKLLVSLNTTIFFLSALFFLLSVRLSMRPDLNRNNNFLKESSYFSPIFDRIDIPVSIIQFNGSFINQPHTIYRDDPSPLVDAAWDRISLVDTIAVSSADVLRLGKDPTIAAKYPVDYGLGPDAYVAEIDVFHQIHCLNALRKEIFFDYYYSDVFPSGQPDDLHKAHTSHCLYTLLQNLMCHADVSTITHNWVQGQIHPFPDFGINKKCRDFEAILKYQTEKHVDFETYKWLRRPEGTMELEMTEEFLDIWKLPPRYGGLRNGTGRG
ncbi:MAG: hypothetical protein LQ342_003665 [Letrouitia transgressa]|nr:MAG: hypothetical protein LQ342_003665 [Letrouitia transgressa]